MEYRRYYRSSLFLIHHDMANDTEEEKKKDGADADTGKNPGTDTTVDVNPALESDAKGNGSPMPRHEDSNPQ